MPRLFDREGVEIGIACDGKDCDGNPVLYKTAVCLGWYIDGRTEPERAYCPLCRAKYEALSDTPVIEKNAGCRMCGNFCSLEGNCRFSLKDLPATYHPILGYEKPLQVWTCLEKNLNGDCPHWKTREFDKPAITKSQPSNPAKKHWYDWFNKKKHIELTLEVK